MNRSLFKAYLNEYSKYLKRRAEKRCLVLNQLHAHIFSLEDHKEFKKTNKTIYVDSNSFDNIKLVYLVSRTTSTCQPSDCGFYATVQKRYSSWFNSQDGKFELTRGDKIKKVLKINFNQFNFFFRFLKFCAKSTRRSFKAAGTTLS